MASIPDKRGDEMWMETEEMELAEAMEIDAENDDAPNSLNAEAETEGESGRVYEMADVTTLQGAFKNLTLLAQSQLQDQPHSTQLALTRRTRRIYDDYAKHGSMLGLRKSLADFLAHDKEDLLTCWSTEEAAAWKNMACEIVPSNHVADVPAVEATAPPFLDAQHTCAPQACVSSFHPFTEDDIRGGSTNSSDSDVIVHQIRSDTSNSTLEAPIRTVSSSLHPSQDPETLEIIKELLFRPSDVTIRFPAHLSWPPGLLKHISNILELNNAQAKALLFHHTNKYLNPSLNPHADQSKLPLIRLGISEYISSQVDAIFDTANTHPLGLSPETRKFLRQMYEKHPSLNPIEKDILARACRVQEDTITEFWDDLTIKRRAWHAMRLFVAAREIEASRRAKAEGRF